MVPYLLEHCTVAVKQGDKETLAVRMRKFHCRVSVFRIPVTLFHSPQQAVSILCSLSTISFHWLCFSLFPLGCLGEWKHFCLILLTALKLLVSPLMFMSSCHLLPWRHFKIASQSELRNLPRQWDGSFYPLKNIYMSFSLSPTDLAVSFPFSCSIFCASELLWSSSVWVSFSESLFYTLLGISKPWGYPKSADTSLTHEWCRFCLKFYEQGRSELVLK